MAARNVTIVDDGTLEGRRGSLNFDDEGCPTQRTVLIEDGVLRGCMQDALSARLMNMKPTGNGRREGYAVLPMPRMTNTFMLNGDCEHEEIIESVKRGIYVAGLEGGQVEAAVAEARTLPGAGRAGNWLAAAGRYLEARRALDVLEDAATRLPVAEAVEVGPVAPGPLSAEPFL